MLKGKLRVSMAPTALLATTLAVTGCKSRPTDAGQPAGNDPGKSGGVRTKLFETTKPITTPAGTDGLHTGRALAYFLAAAFPFWNKKPSRFCNSPALSDLALCHDFNP